jgi:hypothetical protein
MPGMIVFKKKCSESNLGFLEHIVAPCQHHWIAAEEKCSLKVLMN